MSSYRGVCMKKKKNLCPEWDLNCCTPAWRSELLPTGLLGSVNRCWLGVASTPHSNVWGNKIGRISKTKAKIKNPILFFLIRSRATCTCKIKPWNASYGLKHYIILYYIILHYLWPVTQKGYYPTQSSIFSLRTQNYRHPMHSLCIIFY